MGHEKGRAALHDFIKERRTPKPKERRETTKEEDIQTSLRELGTEHNRAFETLEKVAKKKGGESIGNLLRVRSARAELRDLEERKKSTPLSSDEASQLKKLTGKMKGFSDKEVDAMFDAARDALAQMVPNNRLREPAEVFPWLKIPEGQKQSPYDTHLQRISGTFDFKIKGLPDDERVAIRSMAAQMQAAHRNDVFLRKLFGPEKNNPIMSIYGERTRAEQSVRPPRAEVSDKAAE